MCESNSNASIGEGGEEFSRWRRTFEEALTQDEFSRVRREKRKERRKKRKKEKKRKEKLNVRVKLQRFHWGRRRGIFSLAEALAEKDLLILCSNTVHV
jgi:hypothetical protein